MPGFKIRFMTTFTSLKISLYFIASLNDSFSPKTMNVMLGLAALTTPLPFGGMPQLANRDELYSTESEFVSAVYFLPF